MRFVADTSFLISLAKSGLLSTILPLVPMELMVIGAVYAEAVSDGYAGGYPDASAIETALHEFNITPSPPSPSHHTVDNLVAAACEDADGVITNDLALGRRVRNTGKRWLRTVDVILVMQATSRLDDAQATSAITALRASGRITDAIAAAAMESLK